MLALGVRASTVCGSESSLRGMEKSAVQTEECVLERRSEEEPVTQQWLYSSEGDLKGG